MNIGDSFEVLDISWICPTEGCGEEHGYTSQDSDFIAFLPRREICDKCGAAARLEYDGEKIVVADNDLVQVRIRNVHVVNQGAYIISPEELPEYRSDYYPQDVYRDAREGLQRLAHTTVDEGLGELFRRIVFQQYITIIETLLHDVVLAVVKTDSKAANEIVLRSTLFNDFKISLKAIAANPDYVRDKVIGAIQNISWHDFGKVEPIFKAVFGRSLFSDEKVRRRLMNAVSRRHDIVHRNGKNKNGDLNDVSSADISRLSIDVHILAEHVCDVFEEWNLDLCVKRTERLAP